MEASIPIRNRPKRHPGRCGSRWRACKSEEGPCSPWWVPRSSPATHLRWLMMMMMMMGLHERKRRGYPWTLECSKEEWMNEWMRRGMIAKGRGVATSSFYSHGGFNSCWGICRLEFGRASFVCFLGKRARDSVGVIRTRSGANRTQGEIEAKSSPFHINTWLG